MKALGLWLVVIPQQVFNIRYHRQIKFDSSFQMLWILETALILTFVFHHLNHSNKEGFLFVSAYESIYWSMLQPWRRDHICAIQTTVSNTRYILYQAYS